ncbi:hypothetical protein BU15DRAFT_63795 [Melanogaster broomeanus]|nr:hypothetical protein BU15DRAFT_63795 [Melanogaster broomeanus]
MIREFDVGIAKDTVVPSKLEECYSINPGHTDHAITCERQSYYLRLCSECHAAVRKTNPVPEPVKTYSHYSALLGPAVLSSWHCKYQTYHPNVIDWYLTPHGFVRPRALATKERAGGLGKGFSTLVTETPCSTSRTLPKTISHVQRKSGWFLMLTPHDECATFFVATSAGMPGIEQGANKSSVSVLHLLYSPSTSDKPPYTELVLRQAAEDVALLENIKISGLYQLYPAGAPHPVRFQALHTVSLWIGQYSEVQFQREEC